MMGADLIIVVFAVVVIGGMGSILGSIVTGFGLGVIEGLTKVFYPEASNTVIFVIMAIVLLVRPAGLFGERRAMAAERSRRAMPAQPRPARSASALRRDARAARWSAPFVLYPVFLMKVLCFALFACAFNLLLGYVGLLSFGHAAFFGIGRLRHRATPPRSGACRRSSRSSPARWPRRVLGLRRRRCSRSAARASTSR